MEDTDTDTPFEVKLSAPSPLASPREVALYELRKAAIALACLKALIEEESWARFEKRLEEYASAIERDASNEAYSRGWTAAMDRIANIAEAEARA